MYMITLGNEVYMANGLSGTGYKSIQTPTKDAGQMGWRNQIQQGIQPGTASALQGLNGIASGDQSYFDQLEAPAKRQFGELQSGIASRFSGMGSGARRSSGHANAQSGAATDFAERLQSQRIGMQQKAWEQLLGMGTHLFDQNLFETSLIPKKKSGWESFFEGLGNVGGTVTGLAGGHGLGKKIFGV
jgi:hypothetical protein